jgi:hypothetical protein
MWWRMVLRQGIQGVGWLWLQALDVPGRLSLTAGGVVTCRDCLLICVFAEKREVIGGKGLAYCYGCALLSCTGSPVLGLLLVEG